MYYITDEGKVISGRITRQVSVRLDIARFSWSSC